MTDALKPCAQCGSKTAPRVTPGSYHFYVWCENAVVIFNKGCGLRTGLYPTAEEAIAAWNTRASDPRIAELEAECERLRELVKRIAKYPENVACKGTLLHDDLQRTIKESER